MLLTTLCLTLCATSVDAQTWRSLSGANPYVHRIKVWQNPPMLVACADSAQPFNEDANAALEFFSGEGYRVSVDDGATWSASKLDGFSVRDLIRLPGDGQTWVAAVIKPFAFTGGTLRSTNAGTDWPTIADNDLLTIEQLIARGTDSLEVYAGLFGTSQGFQVSHDSCTTWSVRTGDPVSFPISTRAIAISPMNDSLVFAGGDGRGLPGVLHSTDLGMTWQKDTVGLGSKRILCILPSKFYANVVYCGTDSISDNGAIETGIYKSNDTGSTWRLLEGSEGLRAWQLVEHPTNPALLMAAADSAGVYVTGNYGHGWEDWNDGLPSGVVVRSIELVADMPSNAIAAYIGTYGHGVFKSNPITTDIAERTETIHTAVMVSPMPASGAVTITVPFSTSHLVVVDVTGRHIMTIETNATDQGQSTFEFDASVLPNGSYRVVASKGNEVTSAQLTVVH